MTTYIVVADAARARIFTRDALTLAEQESMVHAEGRLHEGDLVTDGRGDVHESMSTTSRSAGMEKLIMVAPPKFLGLLRDKLDAPTQKLVIHSLSKDLSKASLADIQQAVSDLR